MVERECAARRSPRREFSGSFCAAVSCGSLSHRPFPSATGQPRDPGSCTPSIPDPHQQNKSEHRAAFSGVDVLKHSAIQTTPACPNSRTLRAGRKLVRAAKGMDAPQNVALGGDANQGAVANHKHVPVCVCVCVCVRACKLYTMTT